MSDNIKKINLSTPGRILDAGDIRRKKDKLKKTKEQLKDLDPSSRKYHRKAFKAEKTEGQIESGRSGIGSFKMPYNSVAKQVVSSSGELTTSEIAEANRLLDSVQDTYMNREFKRTGQWDPEQRKVVFVNKPLSEEDNLREYNMEKGDYYVDFDKDGKAKVLNVPRGDDDIPVQSFLKGLDKSQYRGEFFSDLPEDYQDPGLIKGHPLNPNEGYQRIKNYRNR